jgi:hypothetical protein
MLGIQSGGGLMRTAALHRMVRDPRTGELHLPHEPVLITGTIENLGRTLFRARWSEGGETILLRDDLETPSIEMESAHDL